MLGDSPVWFELLTEQIVEKLGPVQSAPKNSSKRIGRSICFDMPVFDVGAIRLLASPALALRWRCTPTAAFRCMRGDRALGQGVTRSWPRWRPSSLVCQWTGFGGESDNSTCPRAGRTSASRLTYVSGNAVLQVPPSCALP